MLLSVSPNTKNKTKPHDWSVAKIANGLLPFRKKNVGKGAAESTAIAVPWVSRKRSFLNIKSFDVNKRRRSDKIVRSKRVGEREKVGERER